MGQLKWVAVGQLANLVLPVLLFPVLASRLGVVAFALFVVLTGVSQYAALGVELGLNHVALARLRNAPSPQARAHIFSAVFYLKLGLVVLVDLLVSTAVHALGVVPDTSFPALLVLVGGSLLTCVVYPAWYFVLCERQQVNFLISVLSRSLLFASVWWGVGTGYDVFLAVVLFNFAFVPAGLVFARIWWPLLCRPSQVPAAIYIECLRGGVSMSGAMLRETTTALGISPVLGVICGAGPAIGLLAFAEKMAKIIVIPAPMIASTLMVGWSRYREYPVVSRLLQRDPRVLVPGVLVLLVGLCAYGLLAAEVIDRWFAIYAPAKGLLAGLLLAVPLAYANYIVVALAYLAREDFSVIGRISSLQVIGLTLCATLAQSFVGPFGVVVCVVMAELAFLVAVVFLRKRRDKGAIGA